jgi:hypothetical protein
MRKSLSLWVVWTAGILEGLGTTAGADAPKEATKAVPAHLVAEFRVKREEIFEFAKKPTVTREGDTVTISFATKGFCDVTVAIQDAQGRIVRHLASGVLGDNAPSPFRKGSKEQVLIWDSKNDKGEYVDDRAHTRVRVSLGLRARFERQFLWSPYRAETREVGIPLSFKAQPEGVYVYDGSTFDHLRLFDHQGRYLRTLHPFPSDRLKQVRGLRRRVFEQSGTMLPWKSGFFHSSLLTMGSNTRAPHGEGQVVGTGVSALDVRAGRLALAYHILNRLATDGSTGGLPLEGPATHVGGYFPRSVALSPDGRTLYLTGFNRDNNSHPHLTRITWVQGVGRIDMEKSEKIKLFAGTLSADHKLGGTESGKFRSPVAVDTDPQGRVYVADYGNDRIQIFDAEGRHLKNLVVPHGRACLPAEVAINQRNGDIYVFSYYLECFAYSKGAWPRRQAAGAGVGSARAHSA